MPTKSGSKQPLYGFIESFEEKEPKQCYFAVHKGFSILTKLFS